MPRVRALIVRTAAVALLSTGLAGGLAACGGPPACAPPPTVMAVPDGAAAASATLDGQVAEVDGLAVAYVASDCSSGPWLAQLTVTHADGVVEEVALRIGEELRLDDGRVLVVLAGSPDANAVDIAVLPA